MLDFYQHIYNHFNPVAFELFSIKVHWYGIMYILALLTALWMAKYIAKKDNYNITTNQLDDYFVWVEIGVILGARIGYFIFYVPNNSYYLIHPWQMFNPFMNGEFVGISGMSYHGAMIGFLISTLLYTYKKRVNFWSLMDIVAVAVPAGYVFGRIGNFLNKGLVGRVTDSSFGIYVNGVLRYPSQIIEALLEGVLIFVILYFYRKHKKFEGELIALYLILYAIARSTAEMFRQPDPQLGFILNGDITMGQILSSVMFIVGVGVYIYKYRQLHKKI